MPVRPYTRYTRLVSTLVSSVCCDCVRLLCQQRGAEGLHLRGAGGAVNQPPLLRGPHLGRVAAAPLPGAPSPPWPAILLCRVLEPRSFPVARSGGGGALSCCGSAQRSCCLPLVTTICIPTDAISGYHHRITAGHLQYFHGEGRSSECAPHPQRFHREFLLAQHVIHSSRLGDVALCRLLPSSPATAVTQKVSV